MIRCGECSVCCDEGSVRNDEDARCDEGRVHCDEASVHSDEAEATQGKTYGFVETKTLLVVMNHYGLEHNSS